MPETLLPLEDRLKLLAETEKTQFVEMNINYFERYKTLLNSLRTHVYPLINAGLASLSKSPGLYTDHSGSHFNEVVRYAGLLLEGHEETLNPFELYVLLCAIRIHDAGNIDGRENHEKRTNAILTLYGADIKSNVAELRLISEVAQAHGGYVDGTKDKDTIGNLKESSGIGPVKVRPRLLAAIVRFADEICEHSSRASHHNLTQSTVIDTSLLYQMYAKSISEAGVDRLNKSFRISFNINIEDLKNKYKTPDSSEKYFIDDVLDRIEKLNTERIYCNRFVRPEMQTDRVEVSIEFFTRKIIGNIPYDQPIETKKFSIYDKGYPDSPKSWRESDCKDIVGETILNKDWLKNAA
jgi:hypothetical protein